MIEATAPRLQRQCQQRCRRRPALPTRAELERVLSLLGYREGAPAQLTPENQEIDRQLCDHLSCRACGRVGLLYHAWHQGIRYAAFAECPSCGGADEL